MRSEAESVYPHCPTTVRTVEVGGLTKSELLREFRKHSILMNEQGKRLFADASFANRETSRSLETVEFAVGHLGFPEGATSAEIFQRARELGLDLCPLEVGPYLRLQYLDQPEGFWIVIASHQPPAQPDFPNGFYLRRLEGGLWLRGYTAAPQYVWDRDDRFIFARSQTVEEEVAEERA